MTRARSAEAGVVAALAWALLEPIDKRVFRHDYSDVALLGKLVARRRWRAAGLAWHAANGAAFGLAWHELCRRRPTSPVAFALVEHVALFPLAAIVDRHHPARGTGGMAPAFTLPAFAQETVRHAVFGWVLGKAARAAR